MVNAAEAEKPPNLHAMALVSVEHQHMFQSVASQPWWRDLSMPEPPLSPMPSLMPQFKPHARRATATSTVLSLLPIASPIVPPVRQSCRRACNPYRLHRNADHLCHMCRRACRPCGPNFASGICRAVHPTCANRDISIGTRAAFKIAHAAYGTALRFHLCPCRRSCRS